MSRRPTSMHSTAGAASTNPVRRSCRAAVTAGAAAATPKRRSNRAAAAAATQAMQELPIELSSDESGGINDNDEQSKGNSRDDSSAASSDYSSDHGGEDGSASDSSEEEVSYTDSLKKADAADADMADITSPKHTTLQQCKRPGSFTDFLACKKAKQPVRSATKANSGAAAPQSPADSASQREQTVPLEDLDMLLAAAPDGATDCQVVAGPCAEPQAQHGSQQTMPTSAAPILAPPPPLSPAATEAAAAAAAVAGESESEARAVSLGNRGAAVNGVAAGAMSLQPPPATETATETQRTDAIDAADEAQDEIDDHTTDATDQFQGGAAPELDSDWAEAPGKGRKLNLDLTASGSPTGRNIYVPNRLIKQMTGQEDPPRGLKLQITLFRDGHQLGPILERTLNRPSRITLTPKTVESVLHCTIAKLRAKEPNLFEVYFVTDTSHPQELAAAPAAATPSGNTEQPESISSEQAPAASGSTQTRRQEAAAAAAAPLPSAEAATAPVLRHDESGRPALNPDAKPQSDPVQVVAAAAADDDIAPATAGLSEGPAAAPHDPTQLASTSTVAAAPASVSSATPEGAELPGDYSMAPYKTVPQAVMALIPLLGFMKAPKAVCCEFRTMFAALKQLQEGTDEVEMFKADYTLLAWLVEHHDVEEVWSALGELLRSATRVAGAYAPV